MPRKEVVKELDKEQRIKKHNNKTKGKTKETKDIHRKPKVKQKRVNKNQWLKNIDDEEYYI
ncbi:hypothetical protein [Vallitalea maricola]|uniref:Uncharacterized protein n=1 Tax=Vallitalea maricola TaxID=3074433 RepID=A0ACB5UIT3_9FIRM|nr:hypothetical protein AN2V17_16860 [Vallitalea sp. AN17-2]